MGMGGGSQTSTTKTELPPELQSWANKYLNALGNLVMPGGQLAPSNLPYQEVAPLSPQQTQGMQLVSNETYGPSGPPQGGAGSSSPSVSDLVQGIAASPYYQQQMAQNPWMNRAFSAPALGQLSQLYAGLA